MDSLNNIADTGNDNSAMLVFRKKTMNAAANISSAPLYFRFLPFLLGVIASQKLSVGGELYIGEILAFIYLILNFGKFKLLKFERRLLAFAFIWFCAQLVSDLINETIFMDALKGTLAPLIFGGTILSLIDYFRNNISRLPAFLLGATCGELIYFQLFPTEYYLFNPWKWGLGGGILTIFVIYFSFYLRSKSILILFGTVAVFFIISLSFNGRSMATFPLLAALAYAFLANGKKVRVMKFFAGKWGVARLVGASIPALFLLNIAASALFSSSFLLSRVSADAAEKYRSQAAGAYGLLVGGRSEILISTRAFLDKPLFGHGSWAKNKAGYLDRFEGERNRLGYSSIPDDTEIDNNSLITTHSYFMGALVWAGIFGGIFWVFILHATIKRFLVLMSQLPFYYYVGMVGLMWNIFFSPFSAASRWSTAVFLAAFWAYGYAIKKNSVGEF